MPQKITYRSWLIQYLKLYYFSYLRCRAFWAYLRMIFAAIYISWKGVPKSSDNNSNRYRPDIIICDQISACIPFIKNRESLSWLFPNAPKVGK